MTPLTSATSSADGGGATAASGFVGIMMEIISNFIKTGIDNPSLYYNLCLYFSSGIDLAIFNKEIPSRCSDIPRLLKQIHSLKKESTFEAAFMVLMISIKSACKAGWFSNEDADDLELLTKTALKCFSNPEDVGIGPSCALPYISNILSRCNPQIKIQKILFSLGVKAGLGAYVSDFNISRDTITLQHEKIWLFVAQMDIVDSLSHTVSPPQINVMLNGKTVQNEIKNHLDIGQQLIKDVTLMLEDGANLLQAVGKFNGSYVIALATTSMLPSSGGSGLRDCNQPLVASVESGSNNYRTSSEISLNCPISLCRIKIPVKGSLCKHPECFDYEAFMAMNSKEQSWQCPHCKLPVGRTSLHVDPKFSKILRESPLHASNVVISEDGTWKPVLLRKDPFEKNLWSDILQSVSSSLGKAPVVSTNSSTTKGNDKPNNAPLNIKPSPVSLQHQSLNQPAAVQSSPQLPRRGSDGPKPWVPQQDSTTQKRPKTVVLPTQTNERVGRMRGSLTGQAYEAALSRLTSPPIQPARAQAPFRPEYNPTKK